MKRIFFYIRRVITPLYFFREIKFDGRSVLELGAGQGNVFFEIREIVVKYDGVDFDREKLKIARKLFSNTQVRFIEEDIITFVRSANVKYYTIILSDVLSFLTDEKQNLLLHILPHILRRQGVIILKIIDTKPKFKYYLSKCFSSFVIKILRASFYQVNKFNYKDIDFYIQFFTKFGFEVEIKSFPLHLFPHVYLVFRRV